MLRIDMLTVDSSKSATEMCFLGTKYPTDKAPYSVTWHRHAYTAVYNLLFSHLRYQPIKFGEVGILDNMSMFMWRNFFTRATLYGFEFDDKRIDKAIEDRIPNAHYSKIDVSDTKSLYRAFNEAGGNFDILIDDSTHLFEHQINFAEVAVDFVNPGGIMIIEDVFRHWDLQRYAEALTPLSAYFSSVLAIDTNHKDAYSGGTTQVPYYDNDRLIVLFRNQSARKAQDADENNLVHFPKNIIL